MKKIHMRSSKDLGFKVKAMVFITFLSCMLCACLSSVNSQTVWELKVLSLLIPKQTRIAMETGSKDSVIALQNSQAQLKQVLNKFEHEQANIEGFDQIMADGRVVEQNIDVLLKNQKYLNGLYDLKIQIAETIPGIQAEYNLLASMMLRDNFPASEVIVAKNQLFIGERILRSIYDLNAGNEFGISSVDDFLADLETFETYLNAQLEGNSDLGVKRINPPLMRECLESIQSDLREIRQSPSFKFLKDSNTINRINQANQENLTKSDDMFISLVRATSTHK